MEITVTEAENPLEQMTVQERLNLSKEHYKAGAFDKAIDVLSTISADENPQAYATAQNNLGIVYRDQGKVEQAVEAWHRIPQDVYSVHCGYSGHGCWNAGHPDYGWQCTAERRRFVLDARPPT